MMIRSISLAAAALLLALPRGSVAPTRTAQQAPANLGFEVRDAAGRPVGWSVGANGFQIGVDSTTPFAGRFSLRSRWLDTAAWSESAGKFGVASLSYPVALARGRKLHLTGYIRTEGVTAGYAGFWMRVDAASRSSIAFDNMSRRGVHQTTPWTRYDIELPVDSGATTIILGILHPGNGTAWFDSLTLEVVGPPMPRTIADAPPFRPEPRPREDLTRLLSDAELALPPDATPPPPENTAWTSWVREHAHPVRSLGATDFSDLQFFGPVLRGKRIVQLGESGHGVAEFDMAKVRLIKYLHEALGYDVIAFESSLFECDRAQRSVASLSAQQLMQNCIFAVWYTAEALPLFEYIKQTQSTPHPLVLAGFDEQTSAPSVSARPASFHGVTTAEDTAYDRRDQERDSTYLALLRVAPVLGPQERDVMVPFYDSLAVWLRTNERRLTSAMPGDPKAAIVARQTALSMTVYARQLAAGPTAEGSSIRDRGMADNLDVLLNELFPDKKLIVWAHNAHVQHQEGPRAASASSATTSKSMGAWTAERHRPELYTVGLFMYRGGAATNDRQPYPIARMPAGSLESILHSAPWRYSFVDFSQESQSAGTSWMFTRIPTMSWGVNPDPIIPRNEYDGILFIDTVHPPEYLTFPPR